jgi:TRAP-type C4-dicarboxylate transport system permease small subunit
LTSTADEGSIQDRDATAESTSEPTEAARRDPAVLRVWASVELSIACFFVVVIFISVSWQVVSRYVPAFNWQGVAELGNYSLVVLTFIMVGYLIGTNGHITIQIIDYVVKGKASVAVKAVSAALTAVICAVLAYEACALILAYPDRSTAALEIPLWTLYAVPLVGFASGVIRAVIRIFTANRPDPAPDVAEAS